MDISGWQGFFFRCGTRALHMEVVIEVLHRAFVAGYDGVRLAGEPP
jgi:hypothetical protein